MKASSRSMLLLLGSFAFALNAATALHELGHAVAMWTIGGVVTRITVHPFATSYTYYGSTPTVPLFTAWAGIALGTPAALLFTLLVWRFRTPYLVPLRLVGIAALFSNGLYMLLDFVRGGGGDPTELRELGMPLALLLAVGSALVLAGAILAAFSLPALGLRWDDPPRRRLVVFAGGLLPYMAGMVTFQIVLERAGAALWLAYSAAAIVALLMGAPLSAFVQSRLRPLRAIEATVVGWKPALFAAILGSAVVVVALIWLQ